MAAHSTSKKRARHDSSVLPQPKKPNAARDRFKEFRKKLPIYTHRKKIIKAFLANPVLVLVGETGSGKTTQIPQFLGAVSTPGRVLMLAANTSLSSFSFYPNF
jgi:HrpA-like RNA helicase